MGRKGKGQRYWTADGCGCAIGLLTRRRSTTRVRGTDIVVELS